MVMSNLTPEFFRSKINQFFVTKESPQEVIDYIGSTYSDNEKAVGTMCAMFMFNAIFESMAKMVETRD